MMNVSGNRIFLLLLFFVSNFISAEDSLSTKSDTNPISTFGAENPNISISSGAIIYVDGQTYSTNSHKKHKKLKSPKKNNKITFSVKKKIPINKHRKIVDYYCKKDESKKFEIYNATSKICTNSISQFFQAEQISYYSYREFFVKNSIKVKANLFSTIYRISFYPVRPPPFII